MLRHRNRPFFTWVILCVGTLLTLPILAVEREIPLIELLGELERRGLNIVYTEQPALYDIVRIGSDVSDPEQSLLDALAQVGLELRKVGDTYFVSVAAHPSSSSSSDPTKLPQHLEEITVSPGLLTIESRVVEERSLLTEAFSEANPHTADDLMHAVKSLPSIADQDASGNLHFRGGAEDEVLIHLDGQEIFEPYHMKDFLNLFSALDTEVIDYVDVFAGGFPVEYGDRMSGVLDISVVEPVTRRVAVSVGTMNSRILLGDILGNRGSWLISGRAWYPHQLPDALGAFDDETLETDYSDAIFRVTWSPTTNVELYGGGLGVFDDLAYSLIDPAEEERIETEYASEQYWIGNLFEVSDSLGGQAVFSWARIERERAGLRFSEDDGSLVVVDDRTLESRSLRNGWSWLASERQLVKFGFETRSQSSSYSYRRDLTEPDEESGEVLTITLEPAGTFNSMWISDRLAVTDDFVVEAGLRWDQQTHLDEDQWSPRMNVLVGLSARSQLRLGWGLYHQVERLNELSVPDGQRDYAPPQASRQWLASFQHGFDNGYSLRLSGWRKTFTDLRPRWENILTPIEIFPEIADDRVRLAPERARATGAEVVLSSPPAAESHSWWVGYSYSDVHDVIEGRKVPRRWDRRHSFDAGLDLHLPKQLRLNLGLTWKSGSPKTGASLVIDEEGEADVALGPIFDERLGSYYRADLRLSRAFETHRGTGTVILEIFNVTNASNECCIDDYDIVDSPTGDPLLVEDIRMWAPLVPAVSLRWEF